MFKVLNEGEWKPLRFTVYNYLEEEERYQQNLNRLGYDSSYEDLECKMIAVDNSEAHLFKNYVEKTLQNDKIVIAVCVMGENNYCTIVKPKSVEVSSMLKVSQG